MVSRSSNGSGTDNELDITVQRAASNHEFYTQGDRVRGDVVLRNPSAAYGVEASIKFTGVAGTRIGLRGNATLPLYSVETILFQFTQHLSVGRKSQEGTEQVWSFEFKFPSGTQSTPQKQRYSGDSSFQRNPGHALPPSFRGGPRPIDSDHAVITYTLEATATRPYSTHPFPSANVKSEKSLAFCSVREIEDYRPISSPFVKNLSLTGHYLGNAEESRHGKSLGGRSELDIKGQPISLRTPYLYFDIRTETPEIACAGARLPMCIGLKFDNARSNVKTLPIAYLRHIIISLQSHTRIRTPAPYLGLGQEPQENWSETLPLADSGSVNMPLSERWSVNDLIKNLRIEETVVPTFKTYNVARTYTLHVEIKAEIAQNPLSCKMERQLAILPAVSKVPVRNTMLSAAAIARISSGEEPLPAYEQHEGEAAVASGMEREMQRLPSFDTATRS